MAIFILIYLAIIAVCFVILIFGMRSFMEDVVHCLQLIDNNLYEIKTNMQDIYYYETAKMASKQEKIRKKHSCYDERDLK